MPKDPESLGTGLGPLLADSIPLLPSGARRAGAARVMAARVGEDPSFLVTDPIKSQLAALGLGAVGGAYTKGSSTPVRVGAILGPILIVQALKRRELKKIQKSYDENDRLRLRDLDQEELFDAGLFGGSSRLGAASAYETMRERKYKGYGSLAEAGDALQLGAGAIHPTLYAAAIPIISKIDNMAADKLLKKGEFTDQNNSPSIPMYLAAALLGTGGLAAARKWAVSEGENTPALASAQWAPLAHRISEGRPLVFDGGDMGGNAFFARGPEDKHRAKQMLQWLGRFKHTESPDGYRPRYEDEAKLNRLMRYGAIVADENSGAPTIAHEAGHAKIEQTPGVLRALQRHVYPHSKVIAPLASAGSLAAGLASGGTLKGALLGTLIGGVSSAGMVAPEIGASYHGLKGLGKDSWKGEGGKDLLAAISTYLAAGVLPSTLSGAAGGFIAGRRKKKSENGDYREKSANVDTQEKAAVAPWRALSNIPKLLGRMGGADDLAKGTNLAALKQTMGAQMRAPATDRIGQRVAAQQAAARQQHLAPFRALGDDAVAAEARRMRQPSTHEQLFNRYGTDVPDATGRVFRGTVGGNPWGGGAYNGAFHYAAPTQQGAAQYGRLRAPFLGNERAMEAIHHYAAPAGQKAWRPWGPEDVMTMSAKQRARHAKDGFADFRSGQVLDRAETTVMPGHNKFLGTELRQGYYGHPMSSSKFFPEGRASRAAQNYRDQTAQQIQWSPGSAPRTSIAQVSGLNTTPWQASVNDRPALLRLQQRNPQAFQGVMHRRADRILGPGGINKVAAWDPRQMWKLINHVQTNKLTGNAADEYVKKILGVHYTPMKRGWNKLPRDVRAAAKLPLPPPPPPPPIPQAAPGPLVQDAFDFFKQAAHPALPGLIGAKKHSDVKRYGDKNRLLKLEMRRDPAAFVIDSDDGKGIVGVTHVPTGFRIHMLKSQVGPDVVKFNQMTAA